MSEHASEHTSERTSVTPRASFGIPRPQKSLLRRQHSPPPPPPPPPSGYSRSFSSPRGGAALPVRTVARGLSAALHTNTHIAEEGPRAGLLDPDFAASIAGTGTGTGGKSAGSASTVSTAAASSVWDELDDLKSRIRRLEVTGHIPAAGGASNSSGDRPRTATTTVTTVSSSPRHKVGHAVAASPIHPTAFGGALAITSAQQQQQAQSAQPATTSHPLLHTALAKSKAVLPPDVYRHLELAAKDALDLANTVGAPGAASTAANAAVNGDRTVRRKADSVCRSLTELCLALSEHRHNIAPAHHPFIQAQFGASRPASRLVTDASFGRDGDRESTVGSLVGDGLRSRALAAGRFAERKNSLASLQAVAQAAGGFGPRSDPITSPSPASITAGAVAAAGAIRHRSSMGLKEGFSERDRERFRAPSRAATEVGGGAVAPQRLRLSHPISREYTPPEASSSARRSLALPTASGAMSSPLVMASSPAATTTTRRFFSAALDGPRRPQDFTTTGGPINDRLVAPASADNTARYSTGSIGRGGLRSLRESVDLDGDSRRLTAVKRAEAATERLLRR